MRWRCPVRVLAVSWPRVLTARCPPTTTARRHPTSVLHVPSHDSGGHTMFRAAPPPHGVMAVCAEAAARSQNYGACLNLYSESLAGLRLMPTGRGDAARRGCDGRHVGIPVQRGACLLYVACLPRGNPERVCVHSLLGLNMPRCLCLPSHLHDAALPPHPPPTHTHTRTTLLHTPFPVFHFCRKTSLTTFFFLSRRAGLATLTASSTSSLPPHSQATSGTRSAYAPALSCLQHMPPKLVRGLQGGGVDLSVSPP